MYHDLYHYTPPAEKVSTFSRGIRYARKECRSLHDVPHFDPESPDISRRSMSVAVDNERSSLMREVLIANKWRFSLGDGDLVDARFAEKWYEARITSASSDAVNENQTAHVFVERFFFAFVVAVRKSALARAFHGATLSAKKVHFLSCSDAWDRSIDRLSEHLEPHNTHTKAWREAVAQGTLVEVRQPSGQWETCVVVSVREGEGSLWIEASKGDRGDEKFSMKLSVDEEGVCPAGTHVSHAEDKGAEREAARRGRPEMRKQEEAAAASSSCLPAKPLPSRVLKKVAIVGSSGGGAATLGQFDALSLLSLARTELEAAGMEVAAVQFVACSEPLDAAPPTAPATLWVLKRGEGLTRSALGTLQEVNQVARVEDAKIAAALNPGNRGAEAAPGGASEGEPLLLHGLVAISCDVQGVNRNDIPSAKAPNSSALHTVPDFSDSRAFAAAAERCTPIVGTGGTSLGMAMALGCLVVGSSGGSVATTNNSKVASYAAGLAYHWGLKYKAGAALSLPLSPASIFGGCLPSFLGVLVARELLVALPHALGEGVTDWAGLTWNSLPIIAAAVAARQVSAMSDLATAAGIITGSLCSNSVLGALIGGMWSGYTCSKVAAVFLRVGVPATALSIYTTVISGFTGGALVNMLMPFLESLEEIMISTDVLLAHLPNVWTQAIVGAFMGYLMCYGSWVGWYHRVFLPIIVLEFAGGRGSIWGTIDLCALCMVAAGLSVAHWLRPTSRSDLPLASRGMTMNVLFGDFIEAAYPFMKRCRWCKAGGYLGATLSGAIVAVGRTTSTAYVPVPLAFLISKQPLWLGSAVAAAFLPPFILAMLRQLPRKGRSE